MAHPRALKSPPIVEALIDLQASVPGNSTVFGDLADELKSEFPTRKDRRDFEARIEIKDGKLVPPSVKSETFGGVRLANEDETVFVQFRPDGFTLNNLKVYMGGNRLIDKALTLWKLLVERTQPEVVSRVSLRYINRLQLPLQDGDAFARYLTAPPNQPDGAPQQVSEFLSRIVSHDAQREATVIVTQQLTRHMGDQPIVITIDVNVCRTGDFTSDSFQLRAMLDALRILKNETFFSLLTEETVGFYE